MMHLNIIHRPIAHNRETAKNEEYLEAFKFQQDTAHELGLKTTILIPFSAIFEDEIIAISKKHKEKYGDEIGLYFGDFRSPEFDRLFPAEEVQYWLFSMKNKKRIADLFMKTFQKQFGFLPGAIGSYYMDSQALKYVKDNYPSVNGGVVSCFEEGINMFRGVKFCWHLFSEGGPWWPWMPSVEHIHCPANTRKEGIDFVALPHLVRDMTLSVFNRNDFYASHPSNLLRGKLYSDDKLAYDLNFIDQYIAQAKYNKGYSYYNVFVGPNWLVGSNWFEEPPKISRDLYVKNLKYLAENKKQGQVVDQTISEFSAWYRTNRNPSDRDICYWKDILYNSKKENYWCSGRNYRATVDMSKGGAITDLRPYAGRLKRPTGADTKFLWDGSYPFVINTYRRNGFNIFGRGSVVSTIVEYKGGKYNLFNSKTYAQSIVKDGNCLELEPIKFELHGEKFEILQALEFKDTEVLLSSRILKGPANADVTLIHYFSGSYGTTDLPEDVKGVKLIAANRKESRTIEVKYSSKGISVDSPLILKAVIPQANVELHLIPRNKADRGMIKEEALSGPFYNLALYKQVKKGGSIRTCLRIKKQG